MCLGFISILDYKLLEGEDGALSLLLLIASESICPVWPPSLGQDTDVKQEDLGLPPVLTPCSVTLCNWPDLSELVSLKK